MRSWAARDWGYWGCLFGLAPKQQILGGPIGLQIGAGLGLDGKPRALHIAESMASIDFEDFEPQVKTSTDPLVADCEFFHVEKVSLNASRDLRPEGRFALAVSLDHPVTCGDRTFSPAEFFLIPASGSGMDVSPTDAETHLLVCTLPTKS